MSGKSRTLKVGTLARVEGEGGLFVRLSRGHVTEVRLNIFEPPRLFEAFLRGRAYTEAPDLTARICGICPVAYQMSSVNAMEDALGIAIDPQVRALRRLLYCGEWIESHALHIFMLHAPDFLGYDDAIRMAQDHGQVVTRALEIKKVGNDLMAALAGRAIHPVNVRVGGFYRAPRRRELAPLVERLERARDLAVEAVAWTAGLPMPDFEQPYEFVALRHPDEYPFNDGRVVSSGGLDISVQDFETVFSEEHVEHSNALHGVMKNHGSYLVGPLARYNLSFDRLSPLAREAARTAGLEPTCNNPFRSIIVRAVELVQACDEALRIIAGYEPPDRPYVEAEPRAATGCGCSEAPRGTLYHRYTLDDRGAILEARIVPPTSQNQKRIEADLRTFVEAHLDLPQAELTWRCEQVIRNYDPCISCATHFLRLEIERT
jgi:coenzyme F420-reducing hydrogenase alpha subunit